MSRLLWTIRHLGGKSTIVLKSRVWSIFSTSCQGEQTISAYYALNTVIGVGDRDNANLSEPAGTRLSRPLCT